MKWSLVRISHSPYFGDEKIMYKINKKTLSILICVGFDCDGVLNIFPIVIEFPCISLGWYYLNS
jgi:hypothetical protein